MLYTVLVFPIIWIVVSRAGRAWLRTGIEGDNKRPDIPELWEVIYMWIAVGSYLLIVYMIVNYTHYGVNYSWQQYSLVFVFTTGSNGINAWTIYIRQKSLPKTGTAL